MKLNKLKININTPNTYSFEQIDAKNIYTGDDGFYFVFDNKCSDDFLNGLCLDEISIEGFDVFICYLNGNQYEKQKKRFDDFLKEMGLK